MNTTRTNRTVAAFITAITITGAVATAPPATAVSWIPETDTTTSAATFDIALWVAECKARMAQDWANRARNDAAARADYQDMGEMVAQAKARRAGG